jgi:hypothetical protein
MYCPRSILLKRNEKKEKVEEAQAVELVVMAIGP